MSRLAEELREKKRRLDEQVSAEEERRKKAAWSPMPSESVDLCCERCHTPIPSDIRGLYYSVCPKCAKATYPKT
jgi:hypothetical protein